MSSVRGDCLADQERYSASFDTLFPKCTTHECMEKKKIYDANFEELFPWCKKLKESERKTQTVNLGVIFSPGEIVQKRRLTGAPNILQLYELQSYNTMIENALKGAHMQGTNRTDDDFVLQRGPGPHIQGGIDFEPRGGGRMILKGNNFGNESSQIHINISALYNDAILYFEFTNVTWVSNTEVHGTTPEGRGENLKIRISVDGVWSNEYNGHSQTCQDSYPFHFTRLKITHISHPVDGGIMVIVGDNIMDSDDIVVTIDNREEEPIKLEYCADPQWLSEGEITCTYDFRGKEGRCLERYVNIKVDGIESNEIQLCYDVPELVGPFVTKTVTEGAVASYAVRLSDPSARKPALRISSSTDQCKLSLTDLTFTTTNWDVDQRIDVSIADDGKYLAKDAIIFSCVLTHNVTSTDTVYPILTSTITAISTGCGTGEYVGPYNRENGTQCVCQQNYFLPPNSECVACPEGSLCPSVGLAAPLVAPNWWRADPTSADLQKYQFYRCPFPDTCTGGNSSMGRCIEGHDDFGVLCATCSDRYVLQGQRCVFCEAHDGGGLGSWELNLLYNVGLTLFSMATLAFLTQSALTTKDVQLLKSELKPHAETTTVNRKEFVNRFMTFTSLTLSQLGQAFDVIDTDRDGKIDGTDIRAFATLSTGVKLGKMHEEGQQAVEQIADEVTRNASLQVVGVWGKHTGLLKALEEWIQSMNKSIEEAKEAVEKLLKQFRLKLDSSFGESEWLDTLMETIRKILMEPIDRLEAYLQKLEGILNQMKQAFLDHLHDLKGLLARLKQLHLELNILFAAFPSFRLDFDTIWPRVVFQLNSFDIDLANLETLIKDLLAEVNTFVNSLTESLTAALNKLKEMLQSLLNMQWKLTGGLYDLGGWLMKLKIFIGFAQCFAYFPVTFDIPWPQNLLAFMKAMEFATFDFFSVFGDISCRMQSRFLVKYEFNMQFLPTLLANTAVMYVIARFLRGITRYCRRTKYTNESLTTQVFTLSSLVSFTLYTGISTRIFQLFKCHKVQDAWYLTADYTVKCQEEEWNRYAASAVAFIILYVVGIPGVQLYLLYRNRRILHVREGMTQEEKQQQHVVEKQYGSIYANYTTECYYYDILDLFRRLLLTGGLIMMGEESVAQVFLGIIVCACWMSLLIHKKPYKSGWDNIIAVILAAHLLLTLVSGMALKLYDATPGQDEYQKAGFGAVLITASVLCVVLGLGSIVVSTPCLRERVMKCLKRGQRKERVFVEKVAVVVDGGIEMTHRKEI